MVKWSKSISLYRDILTWTSLPLRYTYNGCWNVIKHPFCGSVCAMPIITKILMEEDDETLDSTESDVKQYSFIEMTFPGSRRGLLLPCSTVEPVYHPLGKTCYNFLQCKLSRPCTVISLTIPADRFVLSFEHFTMKGFKETLVAWVRVHLQYLVRLTTHRPRLRFTYSCCVVSPTTHFAWRARPISWSSATPRSVALGIRVLHTVLVCHPHVVIVWLDPLHTVLSWHPHTLGCLVRPTTRCTDFLPHSQFAPLFSETFAPNSYL